MNKLMKVTSNYLSFVMNLCIGVLFLTGSYLVGMESLKAQESDVELSVKLIIPEDPVVGDMLSNFGWAVTNSGSAISGAFHVAFEVTNIDAQQVSQQIPGSLTETGWNSTSGHAGVQAGEIRSRTDWNGWNPLGAGRWQVSACIEPDLQGNLDDGDLSNNCERRTIVVREKGLATGELVISSHIPNKKRITGNNLHVGESANGVGFGLVNVGGADSPAAKVTFRVYPYDLHSTPSDETILKEAFEKVINYSNGVPKLKYYRADYGKYFFRLAAGRWISKSCVEYIGSDGVLKNKCDSKIFTVEEYVEDPDRVGAELELELKIPEDLVAHGDTREFYIVIHNRGNQKSGVYRVYKDLYRIKSYRASASQTGTGGHSSGMNIPAGGSSGKHNIWSSKPISADNPEHYSNLSPGLYSFKACVVPEEQNTRAKVFLPMAEAAASDGNGSNNCLVREIEILDADEPNDPPVAAFTHSCSGLTCSFDGYSSTDDHNAIINHYWKFSKDGNFVGHIAKFNIGYIAKEPVEYTFPSSGTYEVCLTVRDSTWRHGTECKNISVGDVVPDPEPEANQAPLASLKVICSELSCNLDASASSDADGQIVQYKFDFGDGSATDSVGAAINKNYVKSGEYLIKLTVIDDDGASDSTSKIVQVKDPVVEQPPEPPQPKEINLSISSRKIDKGRVQFLLKFSGAEGSQVDILRDGRKISTTANDGNFLDTVKGKKPSSYKVCQSGTSKCSKSMSTGY